jgi:putative transposase
MIALAGRLYSRHRFPSEVISHCVWLYFRFAISYRDFERDDGRTRSYSYI